MSHQNHSYSTNSLLCALSAGDLGLLAPHLVRIDVARGDVLVTANASIEHVYFLEAGIASIVDAEQSIRPIEVGIFGRDGISATCLLLGSERTPHRTFIQVGGGTALRITTSAYMNAVALSETLRTMLLRFVQVMLVQTAQSTATIAYHRIEARLARWVLMCHDRVDGDEIKITHRFLGMMIAADRSRVTAGLHLLEGDGMIYSKRGRVIIRDRRKLEDMAGESYGAPEQEYRRLIGPIGRGAAKAD